jgi:hypothetical protein
MLVSPHHYTANHHLQREMAGRLMSDVKTEPQGERVGDCP